MATKKSGPLFFKAAAKDKTETGKATATRPAAQPIEVYIDRLSSEGRGMAFYKGKPLFVAGALVDEQVRVRIVNQKSDFAEADLLAIDRPSPLRQQPVCEWFGRCGGCQLQMIDHDVQLAHKEQALRHQLQPFIASDAPAWATPLTASPWHYRHRARLAVAEQNGSPVVGFKMTGSHRVQAISACAVLDERLQPLVRDLPQWLAQLPQWRRIEEILIAADSDGAIALTWHAQRAFPKADADRLKTLCRAANVAAGDDIELNYAVPSHSTAIGFHPDDFTQVNPAINDRLVARVCEWLAPGADDTVADFFCGLGNFTLPLARHAGGAMGYEISAAMVARATLNARSRAAANVEFRALDLFDPALELPSPFNKAVLDPPRAGAKRLCEKIARLKSLQRVVYVSCNPQTLARDIGILAAGGIKVARAALVDMFPQTAHSEAVVLLERR